MNIDGWKDMDKYIKKQDVIGALQKEREYLLKLKMNGAEHILVHHAMNVIDDLPAFDVRPVVRGKWNRTDAYPHRLYCSVCYKTYLKNDELLDRWEFPLNFCPNCGARMEES